MAFFLRRAGHMRDGRGTQDEPSVLIDEAAKRLGVSRRTVYYRIRDGLLQTIRTRGGSQRVLLSSIAILVRERPVASASPAPMSESEPLPLEV
jgi:excisionase family DNA binding protein